MPGGQEGAAQRASAFERVLPWACIVPIAVNAQGPGPGRVSDPLRMCDPSGQGAPPRRRVCQCVHPARRMPVWYSTSMQGCVIA